MGEARAAAVTITGFVERVGDPIPLVTADGSRHRADRLMAEALTALVDASGPPPSAITIAKPAYWGAAAVSALQSAMHRREPNGVVPAVVPDATAALAALAVDPGLPQDGVVALLDFGASGTSITLADAGSRFTAVDETLRHHEFSGDQIDQLLLTYILDGLVNARGFDTSATAPVGSLSALQDSCRQAKERLSGQPATEVHIELPLYRSRIQVTRAEFESRIADPLAGVIVVLHEVLRRNGIPVTGLAAVATVGGVANIPLITQRLSEDLRIPVVTTPRPELNAAAGAELLSPRIPLDEAQTGVAPWVAPPNGPGSATLYALAWSEGDQDPAEPVSFTDDEYAFPDLGDARPPVQFAPAVSDRPRWFRRPLAAVGLAALVLFVAVGGFAYAVTANDSDAHGRRPTTAVRPPPTAPAVEPPATTPSVIVSISTLPAPEPSTRTVTAVAPASTTTTAPTTTTTTTSNNNNNNNHHHHHHHHDHHHDRDDNIGDHNHHHVDDNPDGHPDDHPDDDDHDESDDHDIPERAVPACPDTDFGAGALNCGSAESARQAVRRASRPDSSANTRPESAHPRSANCRRRPPTAGRPRARRRSGR